MLMSVRDIAYTEHIALVPPLRDAAHGHFGAESTAVGPPRIDELRRPIDAAIVDSSCVPIQRLSFRQRWNERSDCKAAKPLRPRAEELRGGEIRLEHAAVAIDRQDRILDVVEDGLQRRGRRHRPALLRPGGTLHLARLAGDARGVEFAQHAQQVVATRRLSQRGANPSLELILHLRATQPGLSSSGHARTHENSRTWKCRNARPSVP
jgi:hypothetical protein